MNLSKANNETTEKDTMNAARANQIINNNLNGIFMKKMIRIKGWTKLQARSYLVEFVTCGTNLSVYDFMHSKP